MNKAMEAAAEEIVNRIWERVATSYGLVAGASWPPASMKEQTLEVLSKHFPEPAVPVSELKAEYKKECELTDAQDEYTTSFYMHKYAADVLDDLIAKAKQPEGEK